MSMIGRMKAFVIFASLALAAAVGCESDTEKCFELTGSLSQVTSDTMQTRHLWPRLRPPMGDQILFTTDFFGGEDFDDNGSRHFALIDVPGSGEVRPPVPRLIDIGNAKRIVLGTNFQLTSDAGNDFDANESAKSAPAWHPDGMRFAGIVNNGNNLERLYIFTIDFGSGTGTNLNTSESVLVRDVDLTDPTQNQYFYSTPSFSPDGEWLAYARSFYRPPPQGEGGQPERSEPQTVYAYNLSDGRVVQVSAGASQEENPSWSPDSSSIVFDSNRDGSREIYTIAFDPDAGAPVMSSLRRLTVSNAVPVGGTPQIQAQSFDPTWLSSGEIVYVSTRRAPCSSLRERNLWQMLEDGSSQEAIFFSRVDDHFPDLVPGGGRSIVFSTQSNPVDAFNGNKTDIYILRNF